MEAQKSPPTPEELVSELLETFEENRKQWPLWTFDSNVWTSYRTPLFDLQCFSRFHLLRRENFSGLEGSTHMAYATWNAMGRVIPNDESKIEKPPNTMDWITLEPEILEDLQDRFATLVVDYLAAFFDIWEVTALEPSDLRARGIGPRLTNKPELVARKFCQELGLVPFREGGPRCRIGEAERQTLKEAVSIAEELQKWTREDNLVRVVSDILLTENLGEGPSDMELEKLRIPNHRARIVKPFARRLAFPFLLKDEIQLLLDNPSRKADTAWKLIAGRLPGNPKSDSIRLKKK